MFSKPFVLKYSPMETRGGNPHEVYKDVKFRTIPEYFREFGRFKYFTRKDLVDTGYGLEERQLAHAVLDERFNNSLHGFTYKAGFLSLLEPGLPPNSAGERAGTALFIGATAIADDIIDDPSFPKFDSAEEFKQYLLAHKYRFEGKDIDTNISDLLDLAAIPFEYEKREVIANFLDSAGNAHWEYSQRGKPGNYGFDEAIDYRVRTTCDWVVAARDLLNVPQINDKPVLGGQLLDDAVDMISDLRCDRLNLYVGMANDTGELGILMDEVAKPSRIPNIVRGKFIRRNMPKTHEAYMDIYKAEFASKVSQGVRTLGRSLEFVI